HHPNVVQTNEVIEVDGAPVLVMEYLDGQPLSQMIVRGRQGGFTLAMQLRVVADSLAGLHAAHELADFDGTPLGVVHRDVSPHNLFVTLEGHAKVLDFGIAKLERSLVETKRAIETKLGRASLSMPLAAVTATGETPTGRTPAAIAVRRPFVIAGVVGFAALIVVLAFAARRTGGDTAPAPTVEPVISAPA